MWPYAGQGQGSREYWQCTGQLLPHLPTLKGPREEGGREGEEGEREGGREEGEREGERGAEREREGGKEGRERGREREGERVSYWGHGNYIIFGCVDSLSRPWSVAKHYLSLPVDTNNATGWIVDGCNKDGLSTDPVHVDAGSSLKVVEVDVAEFCDEVDDIVLGAHLE